MVDRRTGEVTLSQAACREIFCPRCRPRIAAQDCKRVHSALKSLDAPPGYIVLTFDLRRWRGPQTAYRGLPHVRSRFFKLVEKRWGRFRYIWVTEECGNGFPHLNLVVADGVAAEIAREPDRMRRELKELAVKAGFGYVTNCQSVTNIAGIAEYITKLAEEQLPYLAPHGQQRFRASRGFLPKAQKKERDCDVRMVSRTPSPPPPPTVLYSLDLDLDERGGAAGAGGASADSPADATPILNGWPAPAAGLLASTRTGGN